MSEVEKNIYRMLYFGIVNPYLCRNFKKKNDEKIQ